jgi:hypothetical protein
MFVRTIAISTLLAAGFGLSRRHRPISSATLAPAWSPPGAVYVAGGFSSSRCDRPHASRQYDGVPSLAVPCPLPSGHASSADSSRIPSCCRRRGSIARPYPLQSGDGRSRSRRCGSAKTKEQKTREWRAAQVCEVPIRRSVSASGIGRLRGISGEGRAVVTWIEPTDCTLDPERPHPPIENDVILQGLGISGIRDNASCKGEAA